MLDYYILGLPETSRYPLVRKTDDFSREELGEPAANPLGMVMRADLSCADDGFLVIEYLAGHPQAFDVLYRRFSPRLVRYCRRITNTDVAEDVAQEVLTQALAHLDRFDTTRPLWPWLKTIARNVVAYAARRETLREEALHELAASASTNDSTARVEERMGIDVALASLTPRHRAALHLRYLEDKELNLAASMMRISGPALKQLLFRARNTFRAAYQERVSGGPLGVILAPARWVRDLARAGRVRVQRDGARLSPFAGVSSQNEFVAGALGLAILLGGAAPGSPIPPREPPAPIEVAAPIAVFGGRGLDNAADSGEHAPPPATSPATGVTISGKKPRPPEKPPDQAAGDVVDQVVSPNEDTEQPEDTRVVSVAFSPRFGSDREALAIGVASCEATLCPSALFRSTDAGKGWQRLPADGFAGEALLLPPGYGSVDGRIFAMGRDGLQVSEDGGRSFHAAPVAGGPQNAGPAAIAPGFHGGDPSILIGAKTLMRYRDDLKTIEPVPSGSPGPLEPAYSPDHQVDHLTFLGGVSFDPDWGTAVSTVYRCADGVCSAAALHGQELRPKVRVAHDFAQSGRVYAFTPWALFSSQDGGGLFEPLAPAPSGGMVWDLALDERQALFASVLPAPPEGRGGLFRSADGGRSWSQLESPLLSRAGVGTIAVTGENIVAALGGSGVACSSDAGATWASRCA